MPMPTLEPVTTLPLAHNGDCSLLGVAPDLTVYVEEVYSDDGWLAQHALKLDGTVVASVDEASGAVTDIAPLSLPDDLTMPQRGWHTMGLNFAGPRHRGLRGPERLDDLVHSFSVSEKFALVNHLRLDVPPPLLLGLAESYVLAEASVRPPHLFVVCRRLRLALALPEERQDDGGEPFDYDTQVLYVAHYFDTSAEQEPVLSSMLTDVQPAALHRPMDCLIYKDHLFIADGGSADHQSAVRVWRIASGESTLADENDSRNEQSD